MRILRHTPAAALAAAWASLFLFGGLKASGLAEHIKVGFDARNDATAAGFLSWLPTDGPVKTFGEITFTLRLVDLPPNTEWKIGWYNKDGLNRYELAMGLSLCSLF